MIKPLNYNIKVEKQAYLAIINMPKQKLTPTAMNSERPKKKLLLRLLLQVLEVHHP